MRKEIIGDCELYLGDCLEILPTLGKVDAVITDPPYEAEAHTPMRRTLGSIRSQQNDVLKFDAITDDLRKSVGEWTSFNCKGWGLFFCQVEAVTKWRDALIEHGAKYRRAMVWIKPDSSPQFNGQGPAQGYESIVAAWCGKVVSKWNGGGKRGVFVHNKHDAEYGHGGKQNEHQTKKPLSLMRELVSLFTNINDLICDPFMGSGTTGVACAKMGRKFIGIEICEQYFDIACRRIEEAYKQPDLFIEPPAKSVQTELL